MTNTTYKKSILANVSATNGSENQDCCSEFECKTFNAIFVSDGLGSCKYAKLSSEKVIDAFKSQASSWAKKNDKKLKVKFPETFKKVKKELIDFRNKNITEEEKNQQNLFGATAIALLETEEKITIAYVGNGSIWHVRGNFNEFPDNYLFPWNAVNYLNPHTTPEKGQEVLYRLVSDSDNFTECVPTIFEIKKDNSIGDIFMVCTDGIYSEDQLRVGKNDKGIWVHYTPIMLKFFNFLKHYFKDYQPYDTGNFKEALSHFINDLKPILDDDATIGVLITKETLNFQNQINMLKKDENNSGKTI